MANEVIMDDGDNGEDCDYVVCIKVTDPLKFDDNLISRCCLCDAPVQHRPHSPTTPKKVCWECVQPQMEKEMKADNLGIVITDKTRRDVIDYLAKKMRH